MTLIEAIESYLTLKRSLGAVFAADARILRSFGRALGDVPPTRSTATPARPSAAAQVRRPASGSGSTTPCAASSAT
jgi:hypothetical protein